MAFGMIDSPRGLGICVHGGARVRAGWSLVLVLIIVALAVTGCGRKPDLSLDDVQAVRFHSNLKGLTREASEAEVERFVEAYSAARDLDDDFGTTPPAQLEPVALLSRYAGRVCGYDRDKDIFILSICGQTQTLTGPLARGGIDGSVERLVREAAEYRRNALLRDSVLWSSLLMPWEALRGPARRGTIALARTLGRWSNTAAAALGRWRSACLSPNPSARDRLAILGKT